MDRIIFFIRENIRLLLGLAVVLFTIVLLVTLLISRRSPEVKIGNETFKVKIADSESEKQIGLSDTESLKDNEGMLFLFENPDHYSFWMKEMNFPIDIIYIRDNKVISIIKNAQPPSSDNAELQIYKPEEPSDKVLEINAGLSDKLNIQKGTTIKVNNL